MLTSLVGASMVCEVFHQKYQNVYYNGSMHSGSRSRAPLIHNSLQLISQRGDWQNRWRSASQVQLLVIQAQSKPDD